jgi:hypothetical protein
VLLADLDPVNGPRETRLVGVRRVATADEHPARGIHRALGVVVHVLAFHPCSIRRISWKRKHDGTCAFTRQHDLVIPGEIGFVVPRDVTS